LKFFLTNQIILVFRIKKKDEDMEFDEEEFQKLLNSTTVVNKVESEKDMESEEEIPRKSSFSIPFQVLQMNQKVLQSKSTMNLNLQKVKKCSILNFHSCEIFIFAN
jgi:hypothetical protein